MASETTQSKKSAELACRVMGDDYATVEGVALARNRSSQPLFLNNTIKYASVSKWS
ncbi:MAG: hypothetical protein IJF11_04065 [Clostridia bacterium]|nr:hypothetical protein [Clostridia bacterium]